LSKGSGHITPKSVKPAPHTNVLATKPGGRLIIQDQAGRSHEIPTRGVSYTVKATALQTTSLAKQVHPNVQNAIKKLGSRNDETIRVRLGGKVHNLEDLQRSNRELKKHRGPVRVDRLLRELDKKGFRLVKKNDGTPGSSSIFARVVSVKGHDESTKDYIDAVRIDLRNSVTRNVADAEHIQRRDKAQRQTHLSMPDPMSIGRQLKAVQDGEKYKGDYNHWHHERLPYERFAEYLTKPTGGSHPFVEKYDSLGQVVPATGSQPFDRKVNTRTEE
jgi:hypothetical protein